MKDIFQELLKREMRKPMKIKFLIVKESGMGMSYAAMNIMGLYKAVGYKVCTLNDKAE